MFYDFSMFISVTQQGQLGAKGNSWVPVTRKLVSLIARQGMHLEAQNHPAYARRLAPIISRVIS
jgi:hypothetical protein